MSTHTYGIFYISGDRPGLVDYMIWPWFEKHEAFKYLTDNEYVIPESKYTKLVRKQHSIILKVKH